MHPLENNRLLQTFVSAQLAIDNCEHVQGPILYIANA